MAIPRAASSPSLLETVVVRPPTDISEALRSELFTLSKVPGWISAAVTRRDGLVIEHTFGTAHEATVLCAMAAAVVGSARSTGDHLGQGPFTYSIIQYADGVLLVMEAGPEAILTCLLQTHANLGLALLKVAQVARRIEDRLEEM